MNDGPAFSHFGVFVRDLDRVVAFYESVLDFVETDRGEVGDRRIVFLSRDPKEHHQLVFVSGLREKPAEEIVNQISFRLPGLESLQAYAARATAAGAADMRGMNHGNAWAAYFRDPEGNRVELFVDTPWYISQPCREPMDLARPAEAIAAETEAWCREQPGFKPAAAFHAEVAAKLAPRMQAA
jgi:catechol-2,3-dioxygenase